VPPIAALTSTTPGSPPVSGVSPGTRTAPIKKVDEDLQVVWAEVFVPDIPDSQNDFMSRETIREMAWGFMHKQALAKIDVQHSQIESGSFVVESFIARDDDQIFVPGSWVLGVQVPDQELWGLVKSGELNGFSLDGFGVRTKTDMELVVPETMGGETDVVAGHKHVFEVGFDDQGNFLGGQTVPAADGHFHAIIKGTLTEESSGHAHRFSFVEGIVSAQAAA
jgi:hypothetical protein